MFITSYVFITYKHKTTRYYNILLGVRMCRTTQYKVEEPRCTMMTARDVQNKNLWLSLKLLSD